MAVTLTGATGLFTIIGKMFFAENTARTASGTTVPTEMDDAYAQFKNLALDQAFLETQSGVEASDKEYQTADSTLNSSIRDWAEKLVIKLVNDDNQQLDRTLETALIELIAQMTASADSVNASASSLSLATGGSNIGDPAIVTSVVSGVGGNQENTLGENIEFTVIATGDANQTLQLEGEEEQSSKLGNKWPVGSGVSNSLVTNAAGGLLANGGFDDEDDVVNQPDDWVVSVGVVGTDITMSDFEVQTVIISGTPTGGHYLISWVDSNSKTQTTIPIAFDASKSTFQSALRGIKGLGTVTVATTGTSPNFTHTVTFDEIAGNVAQLTSTDNMTGGTPAIAHATTTAGTTNAYVGKAMLQTGDAATLTTIQQKISGLKAETPYAVNLWIAVDVFPVAGVITIDLVDGIGGTVINDTAGTANSFTINPKSGGDIASVDVFAPQNAVFRLPLIVPNLVYLRIRQSTAVSAGSILSFDQMAMVEMTELYPGGPFGSAFSSATPARIGDVWTLTVTQDRAGEFQEQFERNFEMRAKGLLLPSNSAGAETILDSLIS